MEVSKSRKKVARNYLIFYAVHIVRKMFVNYFHETLKQIMVTSAYGQHELSMSTQFVSILSKHLNKP